MKNPMFYLLMALTSVSVSQANEIYVGVDQQPFDNSQSQLPLTMPVCLAESWLGVSEVIQTLVTRAQEKSPKAFVKIPGHEDEICIEPTLVDADHRVYFNLIFSEVGKLTGDRVVIPSFTTDKVSGFGEQKPFAKKKGADLHNRPLRNEGRAFGRMMLRSQTLVVPMQLVGMYRLLKLPSEITNWEENPLDDAWNNYKHNISRLPVWDRDNWKTNYLEHPFAGSMYYNSVRSQGATRLQSFLAAAVISTVGWEYGFEAIVERPSIQDLFITPVGGALIGELSHIATMAMRRNGFTFLEKVGVLVLNPMYYLNNGFRTTGKR